ncbi:MAG TPA: ABC transporter ATP-binding protein [Pyrinomonadaceae bacterium]
MSSAPKPPDMPPGMPTGKPLNAPNGPMPAGKPVAGPPPGAMPPGAMMGMPMPAGKLSARPYIKRALGLLSHHKGIVALSILMALLTTLIPFVYSAAFGPLMAILGGVAADPARWDGIWNLTGRLYSKPNAAELTGFQGWLATPLSFATIFAIWALALVLSHVTSFVRAWLDSKLDQRLITDIRQQVYDHMQSLSLDFFTGGKTGALMQRVSSESSGVQRLLTQVLLTPLIDTIVLLIAFIYLLGLSWKMTLVAIALGPLALLMFRYTSGKLQKSAMQMALSGRDLGAELEETISGMADIQVFNAQKKRSARFNAVSKASARFNAEMIAWVYAGASGAQIFIALSTALVLLVGILFGRQLGLTIASIIVFVQFVPQMFGPVQRLIKSYTDYQSLVPNVVSTYQLLDTKPTVVEKPGAKELGEVHGDITFENVHFGYSPTQKVLNGLSFHIREGETIAFVGPIGCGKSTIMNCVLRFLDPSEGRILIEGKDISDYTLNSLREQVSKLSQFPFFLKETIRENVRLGKEGATDAEIEEACKLAHIHDVIVDPQRMPQGYDTVVDVSVPSGGQKRLIALARCLLRKPEVLLLDEPTENLDADQRNRLITVIREYAKERTCIVISHDLNFVAAVADRIIVLKDGRVADEGTHEELINREGLYKTLYNLKNVDPSLLRTRGDDAGAMPLGVPQKGAPPPGMKVKMV